MRSEVALKLFGYIEVVYKRARIHSALGDLSLSELEEANWLDDEGSLKAV
jgi:putative transposase